MGRVSTGELLCIPYLDTDTSKDTALANAELANRGYPGWLVVAMRKVCAIGLWHQALLWEEWHLDLSDVAAGYGLLLLVFGAAAIVLGNVAIPKLAMAGLVLAPVGLGLLGLAVLGWKRHRRKMDALIKEQVKNGEL